MHDLWNSENKWLTSEDLGYLNDTLLINYEWLDSMIYDCTYCYVFTNNSIK